MATKVLERRYDKIQRRKGDEGGDEDDGRAKEEFFEAAARLVEAAAAPESAECARRVCRLFLKRDKDDDRERYSYLEGGEDMHKGFRFPPNRRRRLK